jgi:hypothetical protein
MGRGDVLFISGRKGRRDEHLLEQSVERNQGALLEEGGRPDGRNRGPEEKLKAAIDWLGERWLLHPSNAPVKSKYNQWGKEE